MNQEYKPFTAEVNEYFEEGDEWETVTSGRSRRKGGNSQQPASQSTQGGSVGAAEKSERNLKTLNY